MTQSTTQKPNSYLRKDIETIAQYIERIYERCGEEHDTEVLCEMARAVCQTIHDTYPNFIGLKGDYSGSGDSGYSDMHQAQFKDEKHKKEPIPPAWQKFIKQFDDIFDNLCWDIPESINPGMELDAGCRGDIYIDLKDEPNKEGHLWHIKIEHTEYIETEQDDEYVL
jgi:hypothetical protein